MPNPDVVISRRAAARLAGGHVWVYRSDLAHHNHLAAGALVGVRDERNRLLGSALYSSASQIALRMVAPKRVQEGEELSELVRQRVREAVAYRRRVVADSCNAYRVIFSEADGLPGLIADRYNDVLSLQALTQAMDRDDLKQVALGELMQQFPAEVTSVVERIEPHVRALEHLPTQEAHLQRGEKSRTVYQLNGILFHYDGLSGQKTGAFLDQRENYAAAAQYAHGAALDVFCYQGGFALHLGRKCTSVTAVDSSRPALEVAEQNEQLNPGAPEIEWIEANAFDLLKDYSGSGRRYDTIVLDPPAFAKNKTAIPTALRGYKELNLRALKMLNPGGVLVTCSCSYHVSEQDFREMLASAAADSHRRLRLVETRSQSKDHPVVLGIPETHYLKCLICTV
jgi:23S rRNA (cytosine1962-C5)-methyltransferase